MTPPAFRAVALGMVHGRFQPFHNGHLEYVLDAFGRCGELLIGITNPEPEPVPAEPASPHRHLAAANPFRFVERSAMIRAALADAKVDLQRVAIVPFPVHDPELWNRYVPAGTTHFIRVFSEWEAEKARRLRAAGFMVVELPAPPAKEISGTEVRRRLAEGGDWRELVPRAVAELISGRNP